MGSKIRTYLPHILIAISLLISIYSLFRKPNKEKIVITTDTVYWVKYDTLRYSYPVFFTKKVIDTIPIYLKDSTKIELPVEQRYYKQDGSYEAWVSGYRPSLDKINVFNKIEYKTITNTEIHTLYKNSWRGYIGGQIQTFDQKWIPSIKLTIISPKSLLIEAGIGVYDNKPVYNVSAGIKIWGK